MAEPLPEWAIDRLRPELGAMAGYLAIPELAPILVEAGALDFDPTKLQARIEGTQWWNQQTATARQWPLLSQAERDTAVTTWAIKVMDTLHNFYGREYADRTWVGGINHATVREAAEQLASGKTVFELWTWEHRGLAEQISGTPAFNAKVEVKRAERAPQVSIENTRGKLEEVWREWVGMIAPLPGDLGDWAKQVYSNEKSMQAFIDYARSVSRAMFPNKPEELTFKTWISPAKSVLGDVLEVGALQDNDPLLMSYMTGQIPSLADLAQRARRDPRFAGSTRARTEGRQIAHALAATMGFE